MKKIFLLIFLFPSFLSAQENPLQIFKDLVGKTWHAEGTWGNGTAFKQEIRYEFSLDSSLVLVKTKGFTNQENTTYGPRNHGVRQYDTELGKIRFWEFDIFGGVTEGVLESKGKDLVYTYDYGGTQVTEMWIYRDLETYDFLVGLYEDGAWKQKFLETYFVRKN